MPRRVIAAAADSILMSIYRRYWRVYIGGTFGYLSAILSKYLSAVLSGTYLARYPLYWYMYQDIYMTLKKKDIVWVEIWITVKSYEPTSMTEHLHMSVYKYMCLMHDKYYMILLILVIVFSIWVCIAYIVLISVVCGIIPCIEYFPLSVIA